MNKKLILAAAYACALATSVASAATTTITDWGNGTGSGNFQGTWNNPTSGLVDIVNPTTANVVNTSEWSIATQLGGATGSFAPTGNPGHETWTFLFDHSAEANGTTPWGAAGTSKVCCGPLTDGNGNFATVSMISSKTSYNLSGYELTLSNDTPGRDPTAWTFQGWNGTSWVTIDTESGQFSGAPRGDTTTYLFSTPTVGYSGFQFIFTDNPNHTNGDFALAEIEVFGTPVPEPSSLVALGGLGIVGVLMTIRRRRSKS